MLHVKKITRDSEFVVPQALPVFSRLQASSSLTIGLFHISIPTRTTNHRFYQKHVRAIGHLHIIIYLTCINLQVNLWKLISWDVNRFLFVTVSAKTFRKGTWNLATNFDLNGSTPVKQLSYELYHKLNLLPHVLAVQ